MTSLQFPWSLLAVLLLLVTIYWFYGVNKQESVGLCHGGQGNPSYRYYKSDMQFASLTSYCRHAIPKIRIRVRMREYFLFQEYRRQALEGRSLQESSKYLPIQIDYQGQVYEAEARLKGDLKDHYADEKRWSLRVKLKKNKKLFGMKRFSLQKPSVRKFDLDPLFEKSQRDLGIVAVRHYPVSVAVNGDDWGIMVVEDFFTTELLESNRRKDTAIAKFDETLKWDSYNKYGVFGIYDNVFTTDAAVFSEKKVDPEIHLKMMSMLASWQAGRIDPSKIFDASLYYKWYLNAEVWRAMHGIYWNNQRFYYNPYSRLIEPVSYDNTDWLNSSIESGFSLFKLGQITNDFIESDFFAKQLGQYKINDLREHFFGNSDYFPNGYDYWIKLFLEENPRPVVDKEQLGKNYNFLKKNWNLFIDRPRAGSFFNTNEERLYLLDVEYPINMRVYDNGTVELINRINAPVKLSNIEFLNNGILVRRIPEVELESTPLKQRYVPNYQRLGLTSWDTVRFDIDIRGGYQRSMTGIYISKPDTLHWMSDDDFEQVNHMPSFIHKRDSVYVINKGDYLVEDPIELYTGKKLEIQAGVTLRFKSGGYLYSRIPLEVKGEPEFPVSMIGSEGTWSGVYVDRAIGMSSIDNAIFSSVERFSNNIASLTGAITFYKSDVYINSSVVEKVFAEDGINVVESKFELSKLIIKDTVSDAIDTDFSHGVVRDSSFTRIGGDGFDTSGSNTEVVNNEFVDVFDKAISIGEKSQALVIDNVVKRSGTGLASKDGSRVNVARMNVSESVIADFMAYMKKPEFGGSLLKVNGVDCDVVSIVVDQYSTGFCEEKAMPRISLHAKDLYSSGRMKKN